MKNLNRLSFVVGRSGSSEYLRTGLAVMLMGVVIVSSLSAADPATQPAAAAPAPSLTAQGNDNQYNNNNNNRSSRRNRGGSGSGNSRDRGPVILASDPYAVLRTRSIFVKGNQAIASDANPARAGFAPSGPLVGQPEEKLVFNGVIMVSDEANAMIEDTGAGKTSLVRAGDSISVGKVSAITFDELTYEASGKSHEITIGQNLAGNTPSQSSYSAPTPSPAPAATPAGGPPGAAPAAGAGAPGAQPAAAPGGGSSPEEILARLKAKRNQELGIK